MKLQHFSHDHPLMLVNKVLEDDGQSEVLCSGCRKPILGSAYSCSECDFFLHKTCAELSKEISNPRHDCEHPLTLFPHPPYERLTCICDACQLYWDSFTYNCRVCEFDICITCALDDERVIKHESHDHPLTLLQSSAMFHCYACDTKAEDFSYLCTTCLFWIHKSCALLPNTLISSDHNHPLVLSYSLPYIIRKFRFYCDICREEVHPSYWVYGCEHCRYYAHVRCARQTEQKQLMSRDDASEIKDEEELDPNLMHFPVEDEAMDLIIARFFKTVNLGDSKTPTELNHFSHDHPLVIYNNINNNGLMKNDERLCDGCVRPMSSPFYGCEECNFFLHKTCADLPPELDHPSHTQHPLHLIITHSFFDYFDCSGCNRFSSGFAFGCKSCKFYLCVKCTFLPGTIKHDAHKHPLKYQNRDSSCHCNGCSYRIHSFKYSCDTCGFHLHNYCAMLPRTVKHKWDPHPVPLIYPPYSYHPAEFYCLVCEKEIHPKFWLYQCPEIHDCEPFHLECILQFDEYSNAKFGGTRSFKIENHPHALTFVRKSRNKSPSPCDRCDKKWHGQPVLECAPCNFLFCLPCARIICSTLSD